ncbi:ImmA/IrrE family metallo-endopeptidase [Burkholderia metallica]|uniref:ImmA/IrrE family metallo-endopeptidase n=1 Tax=Burkholderia metallica TaxID=488729 RepID=UPI00145359BF|nr:ImmA/IrrE family metallo-endopeptidase [Burkholderia metallica]VWB11551.1 transcriptional regulator [Burkholderia metallica]
MKLAVVKSEAQYREYMTRIEDLVVLDPTPDSPEGGELELLSLLVEDYERRTYHFEKPDPVEAVKFRMMEQGLRQADLVPYFGSRSRVSEFLSRQRPLTVGMIRQLSAGLGIPTEVLVQETPLVVSSEEARSEEVDWSLFPVKEMIKRGWIQFDQRRIDSAKAAELARTFVEKAMGGARMGVLARRTVKGDAFAPEAICALTAWQARVLQKAAEPSYCPRGPFHIDKLSESFFKELVSFSPLEDGPLRAVDYLRDAGIAVVVEEHLAKTKLDGAAMLSGSGVPVIGLTLRFDRLDNFWFTLLHECAHIWKHLSRPGDVILDRLVDAESTEAIEKEANRIARDVLISRAHWRSASVRQMPTKTGIVSFAREQGIHPAIVAGRLQRETENYAIFKDMIGQGAVKPLFMNR